MNKNKNSKIFDLEGKTVVIIGGAGKMGLNFANTLLNANCRVIISDVKNYKISDIQKKLGITSNENLSYMSCDVNDVNQIECMFKKIKDLIGTIDGLIYNVMSKPKGYYKSFEDYDIDTWDNVIRGNLTGAFFSSREASKYMKKNASIILTSSTYGLVGPDQRIYEELDHKTNIYGSRFPLNTPASYVASKAGIIGLVKYLATHLGKFNIRVNALIPGGVFDGQEQAFCERYIERTPLGRMANWSDYNGAIIFLISDASNYMTGANLIIDGGWTAW